MQAIDFLSDPQQVAPPRSLRRVLPGLADGAWKLASAVATPPRHATVLRCRAQTVPTGRPGATRPRALRETAPPVLVPAAAGRLGSAEPGASRLGSRRPTVLVRRAPDRPSPKVPPALPPKAPTA